MKILIVLVCIVCGIHSKFTSFDVGIEHRVVVDKDEKSTHAFHGILSTPVSAESLKSGTRSGVYGKAFSRFEAYR